MKNIWLNIFPIIIIFLLLSHHIIANNDTITSHKVFHEIVLSKYFPKYLRYQRFRMYKNGILLNTAVNYSYNIISGDGISNVSTSSQMGTSIKTGLRINILSSFYIEPTISLNPSFKTLAKGTFMLNSNQPFNINLFKINPFYSSYLVIGKRFGSYRKPKYAVEFLFGKSTSIYTITDDFKAIVETANNKDQSISSLLYGSRVLFGKKLKFGSELLFNSSQLNPYTNNSNQKWKINSIIISFIYKFF